MPALATRRGDAAAGARAMTPWLVVVAPFGLVIGVSAARADIPTLAGVLTGLLPPLAAVGVAVIAVARTGSSYAAVLAGMPVSWLGYAFVHWGG
jgi:hypothetical protein